MGTVVALIENSQGAVVGVKFESTDELYGWEDKHPDVTVMSVVSIVTKTEAAAL